MTEEHSGRSGPSGVLAGPEARRALIYIVLVSLLLGAWFVVDRHLTARGWGERPGVQALEAEDARAAGADRTVEARIRDLGSGDRTARRRAMAALADRGGQSVPALIDALRDERTAPWAGLTLARIGPAAEGAIPALVERVEMDGSMWAVHALGEIGVGREAHADLLRMHRAGRRGIVEDGDAPAGGEAVRQLDDDD